MKKVLQPLFLTVLAVPSFVFAAEAASAPQTTTVDKVLAAKGPTSAQAVVKQENTTVISPRTGIRYTLGNTGNRPIILQTTAIAPANSANINRIVATNPALSVKSQEKAKVALIGEAAVVGPAAVAASNVAAPAVSNGIAPSNPASIN
ncbi:hypothetical protein IIQ44_08010 [Acinetobacter oleivorans]|uniref:hypothetical protein n=1 Tax=Acinetobacter oleivorans TaxID=1148157 RepID=UPI00125040C8|nr:hypothetical protein [Acinetobacter oleivorans]MBE2171852.1 hypothetical protein [Acinetobacter oleivorans]MDY7374287.1 hypothetical protein [Acinetobacter oleivorans]